MNRNTLTALIALNLALLVAVVVTSLVPAPAEAQTASMGKAQYIMVAGEVTGRANDSLIYIIDTQSSKAVTLLVSTATKDIQLIDRRELGKDLAPVEVR
ncbi:MAG: hypothetical protein HC898_08850 [Phycisphaerales bacterium]|nr:hypothetical protein [Phycisphaerales bacterium]